jgi:hypothetical protein
MTDILDRFPLVRCDTCEKVQPMTFAVMPADDKNDHGGRERWTWKLQR